MKICVLSVPIARKLLLFSTFLNAIIGLYEDLGAANGFTFLLDFGKITLYRDKYSEIVLNYLA